MIISLDIDVSHQLDSKIWKWIIEQDLVPHIVTFTKKDKLNLYIMDCNKIKRTYPDDIETQLINSLQYFLDNQIGLV